jgi:hypothetical protein
MINNRSFANLELAYARDKLNSDQHSANSYTLGAGYFRQTALGVAFATSLSATRIINDAPNLSMDELDMEDPDLSNIAFCDLVGWVIYCYKDRRDTIWAANFSLISERWQYWGIFPSLRYTYVRRMSTMAVHEHERHRFELLANLRF